MRLGKKIRSRRPHFTQREYTDSVRRIGKKALKINYFCVFYNQFKALSAKLKATLT